MNAFAEAWAAVIGWLDLIAEREGASGKFPPTRRGLVNAAGCYVAVVVAGLLVATLGGLGPGWIGGVIYLLLQLPPLAAVWAAVWIFARFVRPAGRAISLLVAATYGMAFIEAIRLLLSAFAGAGLNNALLGAFAFMLYRAGRTMAGYGPGLSVAFAALTVAALVTETIGLYMLLTGGKGIE